MSSVDFSGFDDEGRAARWWPKTSDAHVAADRHDAERKTEKAMVNLRKGDAKRGAYEEGVRVVGWMRNGGSGG